MLRQLIALGVLGVLVVALFVSGVGTTSLRQTQGNLAFLRVQFPADPGQQAQDLGQATAALSGPDAMGNAYRRVQITLAPVRPCAANSVTKADAGPYTLDEDKTAELALWIERYSVIPMCLEENNVDDAAAYYSWADEAVPGVAEHYRKLTVQMASAFITRAYDKGSSHEWLAASENWTAAKTFLKGKPYNDFGDLAEKLAVDSRNVQQALLAADIAKNPTDKVARIYLAQSYNATNQGQKALDAIAPLLEDMPDDTRVWQQQGQALIALNRLAEAEAALQEAVRPGSCGSSTPASSSPSTCSRARAVCTGTIAAGRLFDGCPFMVTARLC